MHVAQIAFARLNVAHGAACGGGKHCMILHVVQEVETIACCFNAQLTMHFCLRMCGFRRVCVGDVFTEAIAVVLDTSFCTLFDHLSFAPFQMHIRLLYLLVYLLRGCYTACGSLLMRWTHTMFHTKMKLWCGLFLAVTVSVQAVDVSYEEGNPLGAHAGFRVEAAVEGCVGPFAL